MTEPEKPASVNAPIPGPPSPAPAAAPPPAAPARAPYIHPSWATGPNPVDNPHVCVLCGLRLRKNHESYRGHFPMEMVVAIRREKATFHPKQDICKACGEKHFQAIARTMKKQPWMKGRLG